MLINNEQRTSRHQTKKVLLKIHRCTKRILCMSFGLLQQRECMKRNCTEVNRNKYNWLAQRVKRQAFRFATALGDAKVTSTMLKQGKEECGGSHCTVLLSASFLEKDQLKGAGEERETERNGKQRRQENSRRTRPGGSTQTNGIPERNNRRNHLKNCLEIKDVRERMHVCPAELRGCSPKWNREHSEPRAQQKALHAFGRGDRSIMSRTKNQESNWLWTASQQHWGWNTMNQSPWNSERWFPTNIYIQPVCGWRRTWSDIFSLRKLLDTCSIKIRESIEKGKHGAQESGETV